ncbi:protein phosphatase Slingshot homolog 2-like, partial [Notechis scutatus]|uniref:Protein phosphatase Slingshot homolog 2-like n=1 Tax=Notechis scutatus TaxID=8663 RepID=A0A6J1VWH6_9SAUR
LSEPEPPVGLIRSHSPIVSVKEIITEIESIHQGGSQGPAKAETTNNPLPMPKKTPLHETPAEATCPWDNKHGKAEEAADVAGPIPKEAAREPLKPEAEGSSLPPVPASKPDTEGRGSAEDPAEIRVLPGPKWCPGSVRRATLEFEERLRQEQQDLQHTSPVVFFPVRKNSRNESDPGARGRNDDPIHEPTQLSKSKEISKTGSNSSSETGTVSEPRTVSDPPSSVPSRPPEVPAEVPGVAREHRMVLWMEGDEGPPLLSPLPKRIEIIEYTPALPGMEGEKKAVTTRNPEKTLDENCNTAFCSETPGCSPVLSRTPIQAGDPFSGALFSWGSPKEMDKDEGETGVPSNPEVPSSLANQARRSPPPCSHHQHRLGLDGVTQDSTSTDPEPAPSGGYAGNGHFSLEERGRGFLPWTYWTPDLEQNPQDVPSSRPLRCSLPRRSSCDGCAKDNGQGTGLVKQLAKELESRLRQAGLTAPSQMKRSASLAKLDCLGSLKDNLPRGCCCLPTVARTVSPESLQISMPDPAISSLTPLSPEPTRHLVAPVKLWECLALSRPVERPLAQFAQDFTPTCGPTEGTWTWAHGPRQPAALTRNPPARTRLPRRLKKSNERKRTTNPVYNTM